MRQYYDPDGSTRRRRNAPTVVLAVAWLFYGIVLVVVLGLTVGKVTYRAEVRCVGAPVASTDVNCGGRAHRATLPKLGA